MDCYNNQRRFEHSRHTNVSRYRSSANYQIRPTTAIKNNFQSEYTSNVTCDCTTSNNKMSTCLEKGNFPLAMAYVPWQKFENLFELEKGLQVGTIFKDLDFPFTVGMCARRCN